MRCKCAPRVLKVKVARAVFRKAKLNACLATISKVRGDITFVNELQRKSSIEGKETDFIDAKGETETSEWQIEVTN